MIRKINIYIIRENLIPNGYSNLEDVVKYHFKNDPRNVNTFKKFYNELISKESYRNKKELNPWTKNKITSDLGEKIGLIQLYFDLKRTEKTVISNALKDLINIATHYNYDVYLSGQKSIIRPNKLKKLSEKIKIKAFLLIIFSLLFYMISNNTHKLINGLEITYTGGKNALVSVLLVELARFINKYIEYELFKSIGWLIVTVLLFRLGLSIYNFYIEKISIRNREDMKKTKHKTIV